MMTNFRENKKAPRKKRRGKKYVPILSDKEAEDKIIALFLEGAPYWEIASMVHKAPNTIKRVIDSYKKSHVPGNESKRSAALRLLNREKTDGKSNRKNFLAVAIELDLSPQEVEGYYLELDAIERHG